ncbi:MAG: DNA polymerase III subunit delta [Alphaproteobacteria bacterium]|jgi:DNA polymerase III subunit delta|nr:DNA polymerase III subunit delta [Alphaproteobacteria bacterium]MBT4710904.1 DNA polymerase III subunit delta [Alphaproteobacteria bacterium]MBT5861233.1 DNA polymerase III subunit delta [Alphaproteobacteria bacterium]
MKLKTNEIEGFIRAPQTSCVLVYGPDVGLAAERAQTMMTGVLGPNLDPFRLSEPTAQAIASDPALLMDEAAAISLTGGRRVVRVQRAGDAVTAAFKPLLESRGKSNQDGEESLVIVEAGDLSPRSTLRKAFESAKKNAIAIPCYVEDGYKLEAVIAEALRDHGHGVDHGVTAFLAESLGSDRAITRRELEKLSLYVGPNAVVTLTDAQDCIGDSGAQGMDDAAFAAVSGDFSKLDRALARSEIEGTAPVSILRNLAKTLLRVQLASGMRDQGASPRNAVAGLRPPVFFKQRDQLVAALSHWNTKKLSMALGIVQAAEVACKTTGFPATAITARAALRIAQAARRR